MERAAKHFTQTEVRAKVNRNSRENTFLIKPEIPFAVAYAAMYKSPVYSVVVWPKAESPMS